MQRHLSIPSGVFDIAGQMLIHIIILNMSRLNGEY